MPLDPIRRPDAAHGADKEPVGRPERRVDGAWSDNAREWRGVSEAVKRQLNVTGKRHAPNTDQRGSYNNCALKLSNTKLQTKEKNNFKEYNIIHGKWCSVGNLFIMHQELHFRNYFRIGLYTATICFDSVLLISTRRERRGVLDDHGGLLSVFWGRPFM